MSEYISGLVSVIMPTYKRSEKLTRAIESVLGQTYANLELLLVNDNEPDDGFSRELLQRVSVYRSDERFKLILQEKHINGAVARNVGIRQAQGEYIAFLDDDDWWKPNKIERQVACLSQLDTIWGCVSCRIEQYYEEKLIATLPKYRDGYVYKEILMLNCDFATGTLLFRHDALDATSYFDENLLRHQDYQLLVNFTYKYKLYQMDECLHCCDISDTMNRPDPYKLIEHKKRFFASVATIIDTMSKREKTCMYCIHKFEVGYLFYRSKKYFKAFSNCIGVFRSFYATRIVLRKIKAKIFKK